MKQLKRILLVVVLAVVASAGAQAQLVRFGVRAGFNMNQLRFKDLGSGDNTAGFTGGVMAEFNVPVIGLGFDVAAQYARLNVGDGVGQDMLQIPLNLKYKIKIPAVSRIVAPYLFTGPSFNFNFTKHDMFKTYSTNWNVGLGVELIRHLQIGASYGFGIGNVVNDDELKGVKAHNNYWTVTAAWLF